MFLTQQRKNDMKNQLIVCALISAISAIVDPACELDAGESLETTVSSADLQSSEADGAPASRGDAVAEETLNDASSDAVAQAANCSWVTWCNGPGTDGSVCQQRGCSVAAAKNECMAETPLICGNPVCPWILITTGGQRISLPCPRVQPQPTPQPGTPLSLRDATPGRPS
jgi:hypothetical protein